MSPGLRRGCRLTNAAFWIAVYAAAIVFTETWGVWWVMALIAFVPACFGLYLDIVLRPGGTGMR